MVCPRCGAQNADTASACVACGSALSSVGGGYGQQNNNQQSYNPGSVPNYLVWSILVTILCCWPLGIPAIVFSAQVDKKLRSGDYQGAVESSKKAKMFCWISFGLGILVIIAAFAFGIIGAISSSGLETQY